MYYCSTAVNRLGTLMSQTILIVEDEPQLASILADYLHAAEFSSHIISNGLAVTA
jgi:two-component system response regulator BaeR